MKKIHVTRGFGCLESFLAKKRIDMANRLIPSAYRKGRILDIGSGTYPLFLLNTQFYEKHGLDKVVEKDTDQLLRKRKINLTNFDIENEDRMPFNNEYFDVVTMLAVFEHIETNKLENILKEVHRILRPDGMFIMTTPAGWTDGLLKFMAHLKLVSSVEVEEHKDVYTHLKISCILQEANFLKEKIRFGFFEMFMNLWLTAIK